MTKKEQIQLQIDSQKAQKLIIDNNYKLQSLRIDEMIKRLEDAKSAIKEEK